MPNTELIQQVVPHIANRTDNLKTLENWITESVRILEAWGITTPSETDFKRLRAELSATIPGEDGGPAKPNSISKRMTATRKYYKSLKGANEQLSMNLEDTGAALSETVDPESGVVDAGQAVSADTAIKSAVKAESVEPESESESTEGRADTEALSPVVISSDDSTGKSKRGRKPKPENADRVQVSVYLSREVYDGLKAIATIKSLNISDIVAQATNRIVEQNREAIEKAQRALRDLAILNVEI